MDWLFRFDNLFIEPFFFPNALMFFSFNAIGENHYSITDSICKKIYIASANMKNLCKKTWIFFQKKKKYTLLKFIQMCYIQNHCPHVAFILLWNTYYRLRPKSYILINDRNSTCYVLFSKKYKRKHNSLSQSDYAAYSTDFRAPYTGGSENY